MNFLCELKNKGFWAITAYNFGFIKIKKTWNHFQQLLFHTFLPPMKLIFSLIADNHDKLHISLKDY